MKKLLVILMALLVLAPAALATAVAPVQIGSEVADFEAGLLDGEVFTLSEQRGKVVIVNIWATWCPPCVAEMPDFQKLFEDYADTVAVVGLNSGEDAATVAAFVEKNGYTYPMALDEDYAIGMGHFPSSYIPYTIVIDPNGIATELHVGLATYDQLVEYVDAALTPAEIPAA